MDVLAPDVVLVADGGGLARRGPAPGRGQSAGRGASVPLLGDRARAREIATLLLNGAVAARIEPGGELDTAVTFAVEDGRIARIYAILNPHKLERLGNVAELRR